MILTHRPRRLRATASRRSLFQETFLAPEDFIWPVFIEENSKEPVALKTLPGVSRYDVFSLKKEVEQLLKLGLRGLALFPAIENKKKSTQAQEALNPEGFLPRTLRDLKQEFPELELFSDIALDPYSSEGHDGLVSQGKVLNDETVEMLARQALLHAQSGSDFVCASDMMDGRIGAIREALEKNGHKDTCILSYSAKYASSFYGPFREALDSAPRQGDKKTYQMNPANRREALREGALDLEEGADILMVKPAGAYLDIISDFKAQFDAPIAAYQVSGEYAMIKFASLQGALDEQAARTEALISIKRAGADLIFSYFTPEVLRSL